MYSMMPSQSLRRFPSADEEALICSSITCFGGRWETAVPDALQDLRRSVSVSTDVPSDLRSSCRGFVRQLNSGRISKDWLSHFSLLYMGVWCNYSYCVMLGLNLMSGRPEYRTSSPAFVGVLIQTCKSIHSWDKTFHTSIDTFRNRCFS